MKDVPGPARLALASLIQGFFPSECAFLHKHHSKVCVLTSVRPSRGRAELSPFTGRSEMIKRLHPSLQMEKRVTHIHSAAKCSPQPRPPAAEDGRLRRSLDVGSDPVEVTAWLSFRFRTFLKTLLLLLSSGWFPFLGASHTHQSGRK